MHDSYASMYFCTVHREGLQYLVVALNGIGHVLQLDIVPVLDAGPPI